MMISLAELFLILGPLVIVPLGLRLIDLERRAAPAVAVRLLRFAARLRLPAAILLACGFAVPRGPLAAGMALPWLPFTLLCAAGGALRLFHSARARRAER